MAKVRDGNLTIAHERTGANKADRNTICHVLSKEDEEEKSRAHSPLDQPFRCVMHMPKVTPTGLASRHSYKPWPVNGYFIPDTLLVIAFLIRHLTDAPYDCIPHTQYIHSHTLTPDTTIQSYTSRPTFKCLPDI